MRSIAHLSWILSLLLATSELPAAEQIAWVADFPTASGLAAEQRRLVLLHFYNDNCEPCARLEQNVFNKPEVAEAVAQSFLAVKVHAGKNPQLATRYHVNRWPTDVFVTPAGQEVFRTISPQKPSDYIAVLRQVEQQTGIAAGRQWKSQLSQAVVPAGATAEVAAHQGGNPPTGVFQQAQDRWAATTSQFEKAADQSRYVAQQTTQQASDAAQRSLGTARQWGQDAASTAQQYGQQAIDAQRQVREQALQARDRVQQQVQSARQDWSATAQQASQQLAQNAQNLRDQWQQGATASPLDRRSAFVPSEASPASGIAPAAPAIATPASPPPQPAGTLAAGPAAPSAHSAQTTVPLPTNNPWMGTRSPDAARSPAPSVPAAASAPPMAPMSRSAPPAVAAAPQIPPPSLTPPAAQASLPPAKPSVPAGTAGNHQFVPASQAPAIALDGFCPVTLLETVARDPNDRSAWKKGDKQFGAIHRGRTYLFTSAAQQQKFLANPDAFAPVLAGCDAVRFAERGEMVDGKRAYGLITPDRRIFLFADEAARNRFEQSPANYSNAIQQALLRNEAGTLHR